jgi:hypothetical protein
MGYLSKSCNPWLHAFHIPNFDFENQIVISIARVERFYLDHAGQMKARNEPHPQKKRRHQVKSISHFTLYKSLSLFIRSHASETLCTPLELSFPEWRKAGRMGRDSTCI